MIKITSVTELKESIYLLEIKQAHEALLLKEQFKQTVENLRPINLIKDKLSDIISSPNLKHDVINGVLGLAAGYLSKKIVVGSTHNPLKKLLGAVLQMGVTSLVSKNADGIKSNVASILSSVFNKQHSTSNERDS
ncbi:MAG: hypothetical protein SGJ15_04220 [Bacteroidota bacterium]|nr:hypothetical protein [Bacteroidota bacterium]